MYFPRKIKGFRDIDANLNALRWHIINKATEIYKKYGFEHWDTPVLEYAEVIGKYLPEAATTAEGIYSFKNPEEEPLLDKNGKEIRDESNNVLITNYFLALRYDLTAPLARLYSEKIWDKFIHNQIKAGKNDLFRRYQFGPVFRFEAKLDPGRFREFWQLDFDTVGSEDVAIDAENIMILADALENIGIDKNLFQIKLNNRKILQGFLEGLQLSNDLITDIMRIIDKADKIGINGVADELGKGRTDQKSKAFIPGLELEENIINSIVGFLVGFENIDSRQTTLEKLKNYRVDSDLYYKGIEELEKIDEILSALDYDSDLVQIDPKIIRGMGYYTGPIYEAEYLGTYKDEKGRIRQVGSICGGGRYDGLVENLIGLRVPATGASIGVDRLAHILLITNNLPVKIHGPVLIVNFDDSLNLEYQKIAKQLRKQGFDVEIYYGQKRGLKHQLAYADRKNSPVALLLGEDELKQGVITVRNLELGKKLSKEITDKKQWTEKVQKQVKKDDLIPYLKQIFAEMF